EMIRQVRGNGTLVPEHVLVVPAEVPGRVVNILVMPGAAVDEETVLVELSNPQLMQEQFEIEWQLKAAEAGLQELAARLKQERLTKEALVAKLESDVRVADLEAAADAQLSKEGLVPELSMQRTTALAKNLRDQLQVERKQLSSREESESAQLAAQESEIGRLRATLERKCEDINHLTVRAGTSGVVQQIGEAGNQMLQPGEQVSAGAVLAKVVRPSQLMAQIKIAETQARDVQLGLPVEIDTRNGVIPGHVSRVDPSVVAGTVTVDVKLDGALPKGARPDLSVDGTIELDHLRDTLYMPRPVSAQADCRIGLFKLINDGKEAVRVPVELGKTSVSVVQILSGLKEGDEVILLDMELYSDSDKVRIR
ncbi:MAG: HlyD family efflux transporter periplasmic adaptor subunit, partial [Verrucomicrobiae bacterium]|nr:HlyD family efflux transporter periplasmic adaptor subunit [Verrucomicrobiae bacterium]